MMLETARCVLRRFRKEDKEALYAYLSDPQVVHFEPYPPFSWEEAAAEAERRAQDQRFWAVCLKEGRLIGNLYLALGDFETWELGYVFNRATWGQGYATESAGALIQYAFEHLNAHRIQAFCNPENTASWRLLERLGMRREGLLLQNVYFRVDEKQKPIWQDTYAYGILKEEWESVRKILNGKGAEK